jgi:amidophosphoribosyltransferase
MSFEAPQDELMTETVNLGYLEIEDDKPHDECGVFGVFAPGEELGQVTYDAMQDLQHRGQSGAGVAYCFSQDKLIGHRGPGLIHEAVPEIIPRPDRLHTIDMSGTPLVIAHTRYSTAESDLAYQPLFGQRSGFALAHNGHIELIDTLAATYGIDAETLVSDSDGITKILDKRAHELGSLDSALAEVLPQIEGAYSLVITDGIRVIGVRDPWGTRPLSLGKLENGNGYVLASETAAFKSVPAKWERDIEPGEIVVIDENGTNSTFIDRVEPTRSCMYEYVYLARPDSQIDGTDIFQARKNMGRYLAIDCPAEADVVVGVPDSGLAAAEGFAEQSGLRLVHGLFKHRYVSTRSFIEREGRRDEVLRRKLDPNKWELEGKRVVLLDDSMIKGNTMRGLVTMVLEAGATEVHVRLAGPRYTEPCYGGMDTRQTWRLVARDRSDDEVASVVGANSVAFNSVERVEQSIRGAQREPRVHQLGTFLCTACATGEYPYAVPKAEAEENPTRTLVALSATRA